MTTSSEGVPGQGTASLTAKLRRLFVPAAVVATIVFVGAAGVVAGRAMSAWGDDGLTVRSSPSVVVAVRDLARLEGAEFHIERVITLSEKQERFFGLYEATDALILVASGDVVAGVDLANLPDDAFQVDAAAKSVSVTLPRSKIFSARLDSERTYVYRRDTDLLAQRKEALETRARQEAEKTLTDAAKEGGVLRRSDESVRKTLESLLRSLGYESVRVSFR